MSQRYTRRTPKQWQLIIDEQASSALSQERFCEHKGLAFSTFQTWRKKLGKSASVEQDFIEIPRPSIEAHRLPLDQGLRVRLELGAGVVLELSRG